MAEVVPIETQRALAELRLKAREGTLTLEDMKEGIRLLRADRLNMTPAKAAPRTKAPAPSADDLLSELGL